MLREHHRQMKADSQLAQAPAAPDLHLYMALHAKRLCTCILCAYYAILKLWQLTQACKAQADGREIYLNSLR